MGQQQLLLLVLGIVIVGLAVVVGISAFTENQRKNRLDHMQSEGADLGAQAQAWFLKPSIFSGGNQDWTGFTMDNLGVATNGDGDYVNLFDQVYSVQSISGNTLTLHAVDAISGFEFDIVIEAYDEIRIENLAEYTPST